MWCIGVQNPSRRCGANGMLYDTVAKLKLITVTMY